ncbi:hypothetical protein [Chryseobacterium taklimakanense]|uniref:Uncharacterized protein n=1 Tax=Chryseobacterium taklimakanense TaxID=536441 RepID=A0A3G8WK69_9FLAO|nr:hypothetical protein [Chryseobacterium taklimakanense]AZI20989.1 hypothetical protein EIH08_10065 [Chryseobacterium taklimakanense]
MKNSKTTIILYVIAALILAIPLVATQFTTEVNWTATDFFVAGLLLLATATAIDFILKKIKTDNMRFTYIAAVLVILFLVWAELAVGIFGTSFAGK